MLEIMSMTDYPRTVTRDQWRRIWRERRKTNKLILDLVNKKIEMIGAVELPPRIKEDFLYSISNPPLFLWPSP